MAVQEAKNIKAVVNGGSGGSRGQHGSGGFGGNGGRGGNSYSWTTNERVYWFFGFWGVFFVCFLLFESVDVVCFNGVVKKLDESLLISVNQFLLSNV